jgi:hypothetical protein
MYQGKGRSRRGSDRISLAVELVGFRPREAQGTRNLTLSVPAIAPLAPYESIHQDVDLATVRVNYRWGAPVVAKY